MKKVEKHLPFLSWTLIVLCLSCGESKQANEAQNQGIDTITETSREEEAVIEKEPVESSISKLSKLLSKHEFEEAGKLIKERDLNLNDFLEIQRSNQNLIARRILPEMIHIWCDPEISKFLLSLGVDPNLPSVSISIPEYSGAIIPENLDIRKDDLSTFRDQGYFMEDYPLQKSISCEDSSIFYDLLNSGASQSDFILHGAIKWSDSSLVKEMISQGAELNDVPKSNDYEILKLLLPLTNGQKFGEVEYGEGGDMFETDLMDACRKGQKDLVRFMLEAGANPNACLPSNIDENGNSVGMDENGYYPAVTALSISKAEYKYNLELSENREDPSTFIERANNYKEIIALLEKHGAEEIKKCQGP